MVYNILVPVLNLGDMTVTSPASISNLTEFKCLPHRNACLQSLISYCLGELTEVMDQKQMCNRTSMILCDNVLSCP